MPPTGRVLWKIAAFQRPRSTPTYVDVTSCLTPIGVRRTLFNMDYRERITIEPGKRGGKPCIRGLRITVYDILEYLASGMSEEEILRDFPELTREDIRASLAFAADRERRLMYSARE